LSHSEGLRSDPRAARQAAGPILIAITEMPTPRRRRTVVCDQLRVNGEQWEIEDYHARGQATLKGDRADCRCSKRVAVQVRADYVLDVCMSSWSRACPFRFPD
jgi:hypothetical protein